MDTQLSSYEQANKQKNTPIRRTKRTNEPEEANKRTLTCSPFVCSVTSLPELSFVVRPVNASQASPVSFIGSELLVSFRHTLIVTNGTVEA